MAPIYNNKPTRSPWLIVLTVLTIVFSGSSSLGYFTMAFSSGLMPSVIQIYEDMGMPDEMINVIRQLAEIPSWQFLLLSAGYALAVLGAVFMLNIKKIGFHLYVIAQIWLFVMCNLVIKGVLTQNWFNIFTTILIIICYGLLMREATQDQNNNYQYIDYENIDNEQNNDDDDDDDDV